MTQEMVARDCPNSVKRPCLISNQTQARTRSSVARLSQVVQADRHHGRCGGGRGRLGVMTNAVKSISVIRRGDGVTHEQLVAHWTDPHAPGVRAHLLPDRYAVTFFDPRDGRAPFDGMAILGYDDVERAKERATSDGAAEVGRDGFLELIERPLTRLTVQEHVIVAGPDAANTTAAASVEQRNSSFKMTFLVSARDGIAAKRIRSHWLDLHAPNVRSNFVDSGGLRYVVNLVIDPTDGGIVGVPELWYRDRDAALAHHIADDGFNALTTGISLPGRELVMVA